MNLDEKKGIRDLANTDVTQINKHNNYETLQGHSNKADIHECKDRLRKIKKCSQEHFEYIFKPLLSPQDAFLVIAAILFFVLCVYAFFYLNLSTEINLDVDVD